MNNFFEEQISFEFIFGVEFWNNPPKISIAVDNIEKYSSNFNKSDDYYIKFKHKLDFGQHELTITRTNKTDDEVRWNTQNQQHDDQLIFIKEILIDDINIKNIMLTRSYYKPEYPEPWASEQQELGIELEKNVIAGTHWGHNGIWKMKFNSPFYKFVIDEMNGDLYNDIF